MHGSGSGAIPATGPQNGTRGQNTGAKARDKQSPRAELTSGFGPHYTLRHPDGTEILQIHQDLARSGVWRVSYPDGKSNPHFGIGEARRQALRSLERLGYVNSLDAIVS